MSSAQSDSLISDILEKDSCSSGEDFNPYEFGDDLAKRLDGQSASDLVFKAFARLPGTLAASVLEGLLDGMKPANLEDRLMEALVDAREVGSASHVVEFLQRYCDMTPQGIGHRLLSMLRTTSDSAKQDRICHGMWSLCCLESIDLTTGNVQHRSVPQLDDDIDDLLANASLTEHCKKALSACRQRPK